MLAFKILVLMLYAMALLVAVIWPLTWMGQLGIGFLVLVVFGHSLECYMYRKDMKEAPGTVAFHLSQVFLFGYAHKVIMEQAIRDLEL